MGTPVRTALGTVRDNTKSTAVLTLTISGITLDAGDTLVAGKGYDAGGGAPEVKWGPHLVESEQTQAGLGVVSKISVYKRQRDSGTHDLVATWTTNAPASKEMWASKVTFSGVVDQSSKNSQASTGSPDAGAAVTTLFDDEIVFVNMVSEGPDGDTAGTPQNGYIGGQRVGTNGGGAASNTTSDELYKIVSSKGDAGQAQKTGATSRDHNSTLITLREGQQHRLAVSPSDYQEVIGFFHGKVPELDVANMRFRLNRKLDQLEAYEFTGSGEDLIATYDVDGTGWVEV